MNACLTFVHALSPLHAGTGQGVGVIDLPIAREKATNLPYLPGSSLKGALRDAAETALDAEVAKVADVRKEGVKKTEAAKLEQIFGPENIEGGEEGGFAGAAVFTDQRLLCLPVRSLYGTFAWVTSPYILQRLARDAESAGIGGLPSNSPTFAAGISALVTGSCQLMREERHIILEDLDLPAGTHDAVKKWAVWLSEQVFSDAAWQTMFQQQFCVVPDDVLNFLAETATQVTARNRLTEHKTVAKGALWYEEALPAETILSGLLIGTKVKNTLPYDTYETIEPLTKKVVQLGGKATVGRGLCQIKLGEWKKEAARANP